MKIRITALLFVASLVVGIASGLVSCKQKTVRSLTEMKNDERKAIDKLIAKYGFVTKTATNDQTDFDPGVFYLFDNGLYMQVIQKGEGRAVKDQTHVYVRLEGYIFGPDSLYGFNSISKAGIQPIEFIYKDMYRQGPVHFQLMEPAPGLNLNKFMCEGIAFPMTVLGDGARVRLIVPFGVGPDFTAVDGTSLYCKEVEYSFAR